MKETISQANAQLADFVQEARDELGKDRPTEKKPPNPSKHKGIAKVRKQGGDGEPSKRSKR
jgi:hypothetical protein